MWEKAHVSRADYASSTRTVPEARIEPESLSLCGQLYLLCLCATHSAEVSVSLWLFTMCYCCDNMKSFPWLILYQRDCMNTFWNTTLFDILIIFWVSLQANDNLNYFQNLSSILKSKWCCKVMLPWDSCIIITEEAFPLAVLCKWYCIYMQMLFSVCHIFCLLCSPPCASHWYVFSEINYIVHSLKW